ncbi:MAG TPA: sigma factor, partial [Solirubrobacteraceae bacterium]|nr:sigma factor [Solirubrobacteraceae bacterium]
MAIIEAAPMLGAGDIGELYGALAGRLEQTVRLGVRAPDAVIEDACQAAWCRLLRHGDRVHRETVMAWLARTAVREAFRSLRRDRREESMERVTDEGGDLACARTPTPEKLFEQRQRLND